MPVTQDMLDALPDEWKDKIESFPKRAQPVSDELMHKVDIMIMHYYPDRSMRQIALACGVKEHVVQKRTTELRNMGKII